MSDREVLPHQSARDTELATMARVRFELGGGIALVCLVAIVWHWPLAWPLMGWGTSHFLNGLWWAVRNG